MSSMMIFRFFRLISFSSVNCLSTRVTVMREQPTLCASSFWVKVVEIMRGTWPASSVSEQAARRIRASAMRPVESLKVLLVSCSRMSLYLRVMRWVREG